MISDVPSGTETVLFSLCEAHERPNCTEVHSLKNVAKLFSRVCCRMTSSDQLLLKGLDSFVVPAPLFALVSSPPVALAFPNFAFVDNCQVGVPYDMVRIAG